MAELTEYFAWWITDERTGERRLTPYKLSRADAQRAFPGAVPDVDSREVRDVPGPGRAPTDRRNTDP